MGGNTNLAVDDFVLDRLNDEVDRRNHSVLYLAEGLDLMKSFNGENFQQSKPTELIILSRNSQANQNNPRKIECELETTKIQ